MIMHPAIKLRHIRAFLDVAALGTLTAVAQGQGITQPALSRTLAELEGHLGQTLFDRQGRRMRLTPAGEVFHRHARAGLAALEQGFTALRPGAARESLRVGILPTVATGLFPAVALQFRALRPAVTLSVVTGPNTYLLRLLREAEIDLMVGRMPPPAALSGLGFYHLYEDEVILCARAGHPLRGAAPADLLARVPLVLPPPGAIIRRAVDDYLASLGLIDLRPAFETVSLALGRGLVLASESVWFISRGVVAPDLARGDMVAVPTGARSLAGSVGITRRLDGAGDDSRLLLEGLLRSSAAQGPG